MAQFKILRNRLTGALVLFSMSAQMATAEELPQSMGAMGDSITASAFANFPRQFAQRFDTAALLILNAVFAAGGRLFQSDKFFGIESPELSWATGIDPSLRVISHAKRLKYLNPKLKIYNAAMSGGDSATVNDKEVQKLNKWSKKNLKQEFPDYVTLLIGANDVCQKPEKPMTENAEFYRRVNSAVNEILTKSPKSRILISAIPNIAALRDIAKDAPAFKAKALNTCLKVWEKIPFCPNIQLNENRADQFAKVEVFNRILQDIAFEQNQRTGRDRVRVAQSIYQYNFTPDDIAVDCFHPNYFAHNRLSEITFQETWWARDWNEVRMIASDEFENEKRRREEARRRQEEAARRNNGRHH